MPQNDLFRSFCPVAPTGIIYWPEVFVPKSLKMNAGEINNFHHLNAQKRSLLQKVESNYLFQSSFMDVSNMPELNFKQFCARS